MRKRPAYISGGLGDFIAIESFLTLQEKEAVTGFFLFTRAAYLIQQIIKTHPIWKDLPITIPFSPSEIRSFNTYAFFRPSSVYKLTHSPLERFGYLQDCLDFSGDRLYPDILGGYRDFTESLFKIPVMDNPPSCVIDPASAADDRAIRKGRNLNDTEISNLLENYPGAKFVGPNTTNLMDALSMVQGTHVFRGIDSAMSVLAARCLGKKDIIVKTINPIYLKWKKIYDPFDRVTTVESFEISETS